MAEQDQTNPPENKSASVKLVNGWDGKLRVSKSDINGGTDEQSPPPSDNDEPLEEAKEGDEIDADEGRLPCA